MSPAEIAWDPDLYDPAERDLPVRILIRRDTADARILVARLRQENRENAGRNALDRILRRQRNLPWYLEEGEPEPKSPSSPDPPGPAR